MLENWKCETHEVEIGRLLWSVGDSTLLCRERINWTQLSIAPLCHDHLRTSQLHKCTYSSCSALDSYSTPGERRLVLNPLVVQAVQRNTYSIIFNADAKVMLLSRWSAQAYLICASNCCIREQTGHSILLERGWTITWRSTTPPKQRQWEADHGLK